MTSWRTLARISALGLALALAFVAGARPGQAGLPVFGSCLVPVQQHPIPDGGNPVIPLVDTLTLPDLGIVTDVNLCVEIEHSNVGDLQILLVHNAGVPPMLDRPVDGSGSCAGDDIWATFDNDVGTPDPNSLCAASAPAVTGTVSAPGLYSFEGMPSAGDWTLWVYDFSTGAPGKLLDWSLDLSTVPAGTGNCGVPRDPKQIPDQKGYPLQMRIDLSADAIVGDVNVCVDIQHDYIGDLFISLAHSYAPAGYDSSYFTTGPVDELLAPCQYDNIFVTFDDEGSAGADAPCAHAPPSLLGSMRPLEPLSIFDGEPVAGIWYLDIWDDSPGGTGTFLDWSLDITFGTATPTPTASPTPAPTPTATPTATPTPAPTPTPTATPGGRIWGDVDCDGDVDSVDALKDLRQVAQLSVQQPPGCPHLGDEVEIDDGTFPWGDGDCDRDLDSVDALKDLRDVAELPVSQTEPCPDLGTNVILKP